MKFPTKKKSTKVKVFNVNKESIELMEETEEKTVTKKKLSDLLKKKEKRSIQDLR
jgi:benzoyl-CoA reductase/2-hydroxyglutaryl-CoA dehydratase subunit BcrC/BadD/HgdB